MKKLLLMMACAIGCTFILASCGLSGAKTKALAKITVSEEDAEYVTDVINLEKLGEKDNDFIQIVPGSYNVVSEDGSLSTTIPLRIVEGKKYPQYKVYEFTLSVIDANDKYIEVNNEHVEFQALEKDAVYRKLCNAAIGDIVKVTFNYTPASPKELQQIAAAITSCEIELSVEEPDED